MSSDHSGADGGVVEISSDSGSGPSEEVDDLFEVGGAPTREDLEEMAKKEPSPKRGNEPEVLQPSTSEQCSICLQPFDVVTVLSGCYHRFCFACILHWSQVSPSCPLCKRQLGYLMYDITADGQYRTFHPKDLHSSAPTRSKLLEKFPTEAHRRRKAVYTRSLQRLSVPKKRVAPPLHASSVATPAAANAPLISERTWEQRIEAWTKRELQAILSEEDVDLILLMARSLLLKYGPTAPEFKEKLRDFLFEHTDTFADELNAFIGSGFDLPLYDRVVEYRSPQSIASSVGQKRRQGDDDE